MTAPFDPSPVRRGLDQLLTFYPHLDLISIEWQQSQLPAYLINPEHPLAKQGPWVLVELGQPSEGEALAWAVWKFAIWKTTGAVHSMDNGAVSDDPIILS